MLPSSARRTNPRHVPFLMVLLASAFPIALLAQGPKPPLRPAPPVATSPAPVAAVHGAHEMSAADVEAFLGGLVPAQLQRENIAGAVVLVVKDGKVLFANGYGYADVAKRIPVTPDTLFRPGSISKLFTWTGIMQQVEQGKLNLDRDVNEYIDFRIPATFPQPITLRHLMTHTPGFEEAVQELFVADAGRLRPLGDYLKLHLPHRIFPPGTTPAYSNYGTALAGYILQRVSGEPFADYIEAHILKPLGMEHSTFRQPLPRPLEPFMSKGYQVGSAPAKSFEYVEAFPAGSSSVSANDIAHFIIAHLQDGRYEGVQILRPETARLMHARQYANLPEMNAMALGFYEETRNDHRIIGHGGDTQWFHSDLHLVPDAGIGFFVSYNSAGKGEVSGRGMLWEAFLDRYLPFTPPPAPRAAPAPRDADAVSGRYISSRRGETTLLKLTGLLGQAKVTRNDDGTISVDALRGFNGQPKKFEEIAPMLFREARGQDRLGFKRDAAGRTVMVIDMPAMVLQKARWYESSALNLTILICSLVVLALVLLLWPVGAAIRWHYGRKLESRPAHRGLRIFVRLAAICVAIFFVGLLMFFTRASKDIGMFSPGYNWWLRAVQIFGWLAVVDTAVAVYYLARAWVERGLWFWSKLVYTIAALACVGFVWFALMWNALAWSLRY